MKQVYLTQLNTGAMALCNEPLTHKIDEAVREDVKRYLTEYEPELAGALCMPRDQFIKDIVDALRRTEFLSVYRYLDDPGLQGNNIKEAARRMLSDLYDELTRLNALDNLEAVKHNAALVVEPYRVYNDGPDFAADLIIKWEIL